MKLSERTGDIGLGIAAVICGAVIFFLTRVQELAFLKNGMPGPGMFPILCAVAIIFCGGLLLLEVVVRGRKAKQKDSAEPEENLLSASELKNLLIFLILGLMVLLLSDYIGFLTCLCVSMIAYIKIQGKEPLWKAAAIGIVASLFLYAVFVLFLQVPLPKGPLGF